MDADSFEIAEAADLAGSAIGASLSLAATRHACTRPVMVAVDDDGQFARSPTGTGTPGAAGIDIGTSSSCRSTDRYLAASGASPSLADGVVLGDELPDRPGQVRCVEFHRARRRRADPDSGGNTAVPARQVGDVSHGRH